jgi:hypothetical protein
VPSKQCQYPGTQAMSYAGCLGASSLSTGPCQQVVVLAAAAYMHHQTSDLQYLLSCALFCHAEGEYVVSAFSHMSINDPRRQLLAPSTLCACCLVRRFVM